MPIAKHLHILRTCPIIHPTNIKFHLVKNCLTLNVDNCLSFSWTSDTTRKTMIITAATILTGCTFTQTEACNGTILPLGVTLHKLMTKVEFFVLELPKKNKIFTP